MKRLLAATGLTLALLFGTSAMPASAVAGGGIGCNTMQGTQFYTIPPLHSPHTTTTPWINPGSPWQVYIFVGSSEYQQPNDYVNFYSDHNIKLGNGVAWGFRVYALNGQQPEQTPVYHIETKYWTGTNGVKHYCTWIGTSYISGGTLVSATKITYSN